MKTNITISLDSEIVRRLKAETNYSDLINEQMKGFYSVKTCENEQILKTNLAKTKQILKENRKKRREIEAVLLKIDKKQKLFKKNMLSKPKMIIEIEKRREREKGLTGSRIEYYETVEQEAERLLKGGEK